MIAVVTGSSGFIGRNLVDRLLRDGHRVRCIVRPGGGAAPPGCERHLVDPLEPSSVIGSTAFDGADVVFHLGGVTRAVREPDFVRGNVTPTRHLLGALVARRLRPRFVYVSSQAAAGPAMSPRHAVEETDAARPVEAYGRSKLQAERIVESFADRLPTTIVRPCAVYGPRDRDFLVMFRTAARGWLVYPGVRQHLVSLAHVDDIVEGIVQAGLHPRAARRTFFLAGGSVTWAEFGAGIAAVAGRPVREVNVPVALTSAAAVVGAAVGWVTGRASLATPHKVALARHPYWVCSAARAREELGFLARVSLPEGIRETYLWYRAKGWLQ
jgi:nucleoside-diphosphate-sugar epimerase